MKNLNDTGANDPRAHLASGLEIDHANDRALRSVVEHRDRAHDLHRSDRRACLHHVADTHGRRQRDGLRADHFPTRHITPKRGTDDARDRRKPTNRYGSWRTNDL